MVSGVDHYSLLEPQPVASDSLRKTKMKMQRRLIVDQMCWVGVGAISEKQRLRNSKRQEMIIIDSLESKYQGRVGR